MIIVSIPRYDGDHSSQSSITQPSPSSSSIRLLQERSLLLIFLHCSNVKFLKFNCLIVDLIVLLISLALSISRSEFERTKKPKFIAFINSLQLHFSMCSSSIPFAIAISLCSRMELMMLPVMLLMVKLGSHGLHER